MCLSVWVVVPLTCPRVMSLRPCSSAALALSRAGVVCGVGRGPSPHASDPACDSRVTHMPHRHAQHNNALQTGALTGALVPVHSKPLKT